MRFLKSLLTLTLAAVGVSAAAVTPRGPAPVVPAALTRRTHCLCQSDVNVLIAAYTRILTKWDPADAKYLSDDFVDTSDSINILAGIPLGSPTFPSKAAFISHETTQPDNLPIQVTFKGPFNCNYISLIWTATFGAGKPVRGITIIGATKTAGYWQIKSIDVEFNSLAYLLDIGGSFKFPGQ
ncbi:hypothetical protein B0T22DRAFT_386824 [Podospora appendiculata]|uniref:NTF2-like domain-containing protein n=1 Tax=Podospora appendiculata TaxID=314037 RepID=A0AAE0X220_9PEZI|nr:hypothetical protein B0T22DRAFT_386824 [Podospora appendiculata]